MSTQSAVRGWTYEEFARLPDDGNRYEVIAGDLYVTPSPSPLHTRIAFQLASILEAFVARHDLGWVTPAPVDVLLGPDDYVQPDVVFLRRERGAKITDRGIEVPPDLVVEVLSPSTAFRDRGLKRERYADFGVPEYWIIDPQAQRLEVYRLAEDADQPALIVTESFEWRPVPGGPVLKLSLADFICGYV
ncbi:MAG TPA: Uma2 family endonuclease [Longimicrobium sp.]|jgi:Uma2 family endonuclease|nr:Uma2 family endonuclease [Longimicrobium sp.]